MALVLGLNAITCLGGDDITDPAFVVVRGLKDETVNADSALADVTTREAKGWRLQVATLSEGSVDAQMIYDVDNDDFQAFKDAFLNKTRVHMAFLNGDKTGDPDVPGGPGTGDGLVGGFSVTNFTIGRQLEEAIMVDLTFTIREDSEGNGPEWVDDQDFVYPGTFVP